MRIFTIPHLIISEALNDSQMLNDFESKFMNSLCSDRNIHANYHPSGYYNVSEYSLSFGISDKQANIYKRIIKKFDNVDVYNKYKYFFKIHKITLDDFDKGYFESFQEEFEESQAFKNWLNDVLKREFNPTIVHQSVLNPYQNLELITSTLK